MNSSYERFGCANRKIASMWHFIALQQQGLVASQLNVGRADKSDALFICQFLSNYVIVTLVW